MSFFSFSAYTQEKFTISGHVKDQDSGEELIGATIYVKDLNTGASANVYGFYSLTLPKGNYAIQFQFLGYVTQTVDITLDENKTVNIELAEESKQLDAIEIQAERQSQNIESVEMSTTQLQMQTIKKIPAIFGEVDLIKSIQLLPGITGAGEGVGGFFVRGGSADQNLILLDEAPVYNASHFLGFFSVFNPDAIKDVKVYKGGIPAQHGGRLSSLLDIRMKDGNSKKFTMSGGIGTISSRLTLEGPIIKDKLTYFVSGRRTYADVFLKASRNKDLRDNRLFFYDMNAKLNYRISNKDRIFLSGYFGRDVLRFGNDFLMDWGNATATLRWNHLFSEKIFSNFTFIYSKFNYSLGVPEGAQAFDWNAYIEDFSLKVDFTTFFNPKNTFKFGGSVIHHTFSPGVVKPPNEEESIYNTFAIPNKHALEAALYVSNEQKLHDKVTVQYGLRYSLFENIGPGQVLTYESDFETVQDTLFYDRFEKIKLYHGLEPRISINYMINSKNSIKTSYNRTRQYIHLISNSTVSSPLDIWVPSDPYIKPQYADQVAVGYFRNFMDNMLEASVELYYKDMQDLVDYKDNAQLLLNGNLETELLSGRGWSYGAEFFLRKQKGRFTGWVSYTLGRTRRHVEGINEGKHYPAAQDRTHDVSIVASFDINEYLNLSGNWVYYTGLAATFPAARYEFQGQLAPVFTERNGFRLPDYHRLDISLTLELHRKLDRKWKSELNFSIYNAYLRKNAWSIEFRQDSDNLGRTQVVKTYLFTLVPSITYNFKFQAKGR